ncbi:hypothetical protein ABPG73_008442 [Tetrahymena malaccensis]
MDQKPLAKLFFEESSSQVKSKVTTSQHMKPKLYQSQFITEYFQFYIFVQLEKYYCLNVDKCQQPMRHREYKKEYIRLDFEEGQCIFTIVINSSIKKIANMIVNAILHTYLSQDSLHIHRNITKSCIPQDINIFRA